MEVKAALIPRQPAMGDNATRHRFDIRDCILIMDVKHASGRQHAVPMRHQGLVASVVAPEFGEIIGLEVAFREELGETGDAGIHGVTNGVNDGCVG
jgi:hypothetical protein